MKVKILETINNVYFEHNYDFSVDGLITMLQKYKEKYGDDILIKLSIQIDLTPCLYICKPDEEHGEDIVFV